MFHTQINLKDGLVQDIHSKEELEITPENGMVRFTFFDEDIKQILVQTSLIVSIQSRFEGEKNPFVEDELKKDEQAE